MLKVAYPRFTGVFLLSGLILTSCAGDNSAQGNGTAGNTSTAGGASSLASGGQVIFGTSQGGSTVAVTSAGGSSSSGGATASPEGGTSTLGGASSTKTGIGGATGNGGSSTKSTSNTGGTKAIGGTTSAGGSKAIGGTTSAGGSKAVGGTTSAGGSKAVGGTTSAGGNNSTGPINVWIAGDSTVATCSSACPCGWGGPAAIATYFNSTVTVKNYARGGRSIQTWMYEPNVSSTMGTNGECEVTETNSTNWATVLSGMKSGDYLFVQFGINDGSTTCDRHVGSERYVTLLKRMGQAALDKGAHPIFLTPVSMIKCSGSSAVASRGFLTETKTAATALGVPMIDLHALSISLYNSLKFCPLPAGNTDISATTGGEVGAFFCEDHTHFDAPGALQIAGVIAKALRDQSIGLASYLK